MQKARIVPYSTVHGVRRTIGNYCCYQLGYFIILILSASFRINCMDKFHLIFRHALSLTQGVGSARTM